MEVVKWTKKPYKLKQNPTLLFPLKMHGLISRFLLCIKQGYLYQYPLAAKH